ncbi:MAG: hypothetical protein R2789_11575 [Microthrixaceae bacterium]
MWALDTNLSVVTLITFMDIPWRHLYQHLGFRVMSESDIGPQLREVRDRETAHGLDPTTRSCMSLALDR